MRIISNFKDYYDVGMQYGFDPQLCYERFCKVIHEPFRWKSGQRNYKDSFCYHAPGFIRMYYIGFAGKVYALRDMSTHFEWGGKPSPNYARSFDEITDDYLEKWLVAVGKQCRKMKDAIWSWRRNFKAGFELANRPELQGAFEKYNTAIFCYILNHTPDQLFINCGLDTFGFQKILPPFEAYQELSMYVGTHIQRPMMEAPPIDDKTMAEIKGFDKYSFRKPKQNKKS
jgi:hypothetical protein